MNIQKFIIAQDVWLDQEDYLFPGERLKDLPSADDVASDLDLSGRGSRAALQRRLLLTLTMQPNRRLMKINVTFIQLYDLPESGSGYVECHNRCSGHRLFAKVGRKFIGVLKSVIYFVA